MKYQSKATIIANPATPPTAPPAIAPVFELEELLDVGELLGVRELLDVGELLDIRELLGVGVAPSYIRTGRMPSKQDLNLTRQN